MESTTIPSRVPSLGGIAARASTAGPLLGYLVALAAAGAATAGGAPILAALGHGLLLVAMLTHAGVRLERAGQAGDALGRSLCGLGLLPLLGLVGTTLGSDPMSAPARVALIALSALAGAWLVARTLGLGGRELGLVGASWPVQLGVALSGIPLGLLALVLGGAGAFGGLRAASAVVLALALLLAAAVQELIFRGILAATFDDLFGRGGVLWTSALFAAMGVATGSIGLVFALGLSGLVWGLARDRTGSIVGTTAAHALVACALAFLPATGLV